MSDKRYTLIPSPESWIWASSWRGGGGEQHECPTDESDSSVGWKGDSGFQGEPRRSAKGILEVFPRPSSRPWRTCGLKIK